MSPSPCRRRAAGISTAEVLAGSMLSMLALAAIFSFHRAQSRALAAQNAYAESQNITRTAIDLMTRELRMACYDPSGLAITNSLPGGSCPGVDQGILEAGPSKIRFEQDLNGDGLLVSPGELVVYDVLGSDLRRTDGTSLPVVVASGVPAGGFTLRFFDNSNPPVELVPTGTPPALTPSQRDCVAKVRINIKADVDNPSLKAPLASLAESEIAIRNRSLVNF